MRYLVRKSVVQVLGKLWLPNCPATMEYVLSDYDLNNARNEAGNITRASVRQWLGMNSGDFSAVTDFAASIEDGKRTITIPWGTEENELAYADITDPIEL